MLTLTHLVAAIAGLGTSYLLPNAFDAFVRTKVSALKTLLINKLKALIARKTK